LLLLSVSFHLVLNLRFRLAPEVLLGEEYSNKVDIYAFGVILWELVSRSHYMDKQFYSAIRNAIVAGERPDIPDVCLSGITKLMSSCWAADPSSRPSINECIDQVFQVILCHCPELAPIASAESVIVNEKDKNNTIRWSEAGETLNTISPVKTLEDYCSGPVACMVYLPFLNQVWCGDVNGNINVYMANGNFVNSFKCHEKQIVSMSSINPYVWSCSSDQTVRVNSANGVLVKEFKPLSACSILKVWDQVWIGKADMEIVVVKRKVRISLGPPN